MNRTDKLLILQGAGVTAQLLNAQVGVLTRNASLALIISAMLAGFQTIVQHLGNKSDPPPEK